MKKKIFVILFANIFLFCIFALSAKEYSVAVYDIPTSKYFVDLFKAIGETTNNSFNVQLVPPARGVYLIENDQVDIIFPATMSNDSKKVSLAKFDYSAAKAYQMVFVLYMNKKNPIDINDLKKGNPKGYKIETTGSLSQMFEFEPMQTTNLEASLRKVEEGKIDGLLYAQDAGDPLLKKSGYKNIARKLYSINDIAFGIKKGTAGGELDKTLSDGIAKLKKNGKIIAIAIYLISGLRKKNMM